MNVGDKVLVLNILKNGWQSGVIVEVLDNREKRFYPFVVRIDESGRDYPCAASEIIAYPKRKDDA